MTTDERAQGLEEALRHQSQELNQLYTHHWTFRHDPIFGSVIYDILLCAQRALDKYGTR